MKPTLQPADPGTARATNSATDNLLRGPFRPTRLSRLLATWRAWQQRRRAVHQLNAMSDSQLRDIGIERHRIQQAVSGFATRPTPPPTPLQPRDPTTAPPSNITTTDSAHTPRRAA